MKRTLLVLLALVIVFALVLTGCAAPADKPEADAPAAETPKTDEQPADDAPEADDGVYIGISIKTLSDTYMQSLLSGLEAELAKHPEVKYDVLDAQADVNTQLSQAEDLINKGVDVLIFIPQDAEACAYINDVAHEAGVKVVEVCTETNGEKSDVYVGSDDVIAGEMMAEYIMERYPDGAKYVILQGLMGQSSQIFRDEGLDNTIRKDEKYELLDIQTANWQRDEAMAQVEDWLIKFEDLQAIICHNDDMAMGALEACEAAGRKEDIVIIGVDGIEDAVRAVKEGRTDCSILQNAVAQGENAIQAGIKLAAGEKVERRIMVDFERITQENAQEYIDMLYGG